MVSDGVLNDLKSKYLSHCIRGSAGQMNRCVSITLKSPTYLDQLNTRVRSRDVILVQELNHQTRKTLKRPAMTSLVANIGQECNLPWDPGCRVDFNKDVVGSSYENLEEIK